MLVGGAWLRGPLYAKGQATITITAAQTVVSPWNLPGLPFTPALILVQSAQTSAWSRGAVFAVNNPSQAGAGNLVITFPGATGLPPGAPNPAVMSVYWIAFA